MALARTKRAATVCGGVLPSTIPVAAWAKACNTTTVVWSGAATISTAAAACGVSGISDNLFVSRPYGYIIINFLQNSGIRCWEQAVLNLR